MLIEKIKLEPGEKILIQTRRHWFILFMQVLSLKLVAIVPLLLIWFLSATMTNTLGDSVQLSQYWPQILFLYIILLVFIWMSIFNVWTNYYLDVLTITNRRAILIDQKGFFSRYATSFRLERMQDMHIEVTGLIATLLDFGTIRVETASGNLQDELKAKNIPNPGDVKSIILEAADDLITRNPIHDGIAPIDKVEGEVAVEEVKA